MSKTKKNCKIVICIICVAFLFFTNVQCTVLPKEPDNAAFLYYRALIVWLKHNPYGKAMLCKVDEIAGVTDSFGGLLMKLGPSPAFNVTMPVLDEVAKGADPNESVKEYLAMANSRTAIELVQEATEIPLCDWGPLYPGMTDHSLGVSLLRFSRSTPIFAEF